MGKASEKNALPEPLPQAEQVRQALQDSPLTQGDICALYGLTREEVWSAITEIRASGAKVGYNSGLLYLER
jgi:biotin operon repressor